MNNDEESGRLHRNRDQDITHLNELRRKAEVYGKALESLGRALKDTPQKVTLTTVNADQAFRIEKINILHSEVDPQNIATLIKDIADTENRITEARVKLQNLGFRNL